jgi:hypothetical protein
MRHVVVLAGWRLIRSPISGDAGPWPWTILGGSMGGCIKVTSVNLNLDAICCMTPPALPDGQLKASNRSVKETPDDADPVR